MRLHGRVKHCTLRGDGRIVTPAQVDDAIASAPEAEEIVSYQLEQLDALEFRLRATSTGAIDPRAIAERLHDLYGGSSQVQVERVRNLTAEPSGKYVSCRTLFDVDCDAWWL